ncbi:hypothetical protein [Streptomyces sp. NPDC055506]
MPTEAGRTGPAGPASGALLLCRAVPGAVAPVARLLREPVQLLRAGDEWSVLVPEGGPWRDGGEPVDRVVTGWATALAVGAPWPVLALWWDADHAGFLLASGFRRPVGFVWLASGVPVGEDEAMRTFAARVGLDPVLDVQALDQLAKPDSTADARARLRGVLAVLARVGASLPPELAPGEPADRLRKAAALRPDSLPVAWPGRSAEVGERDTADRSRLGPWVPWTGGPGAHALALAQVAAGVSLLAWGLRRRSGGWAAAGGLLLANGTLSLAYRLTHPRD